MNILAVDFGTKNIGLAWCDTEIGVVLPYGIVNNEGSGIKELTKLFKEEKIKKVIVGLPMGMKREENKNTERIRSFVEELKKETDASFEFVNEVFSSQQADRMGGDATRDEKSAMIMLQEYVDTYYK